MASRIELCADRQLPKQQLWWGVMVRSIGCAGPASIATPVSRLVGREEHGRWQIAPRDKANITRRYRGNCLILETRSATAAGAVLLVDFMPLGGGHSSIVRLVIGESGQVAMSTELVLRFGYGAIVPWVTRLEDGTLRAVAGPDVALLRTPVKLVGYNMKTVGEFTVRTGETVPFVFTDGHSHLPRARVERKVLGGVLQEMPLPPVKTGAPSDQLAIP
jgi:hypothetical protein